MVMAYPAVMERTCSGCLLLLLMKDVLGQEGVRLESVEDDFQDDHYDVLVNSERFRVYGTSVEKSWAVFLSTESPETIPSGSPGLVPR